MTVSPATPARRHIRPWRDLLAGVALALLFALGLWFLTVQLKSAANFYDEGLILLNAERITHGELPYRDFWTLYSPGYFYLVAAVFKLAGPDMLVARYLDIALRFLLTLEVYFLARRLTGRRVALIPWAFVTLWLGSIRFYSYPAFPATAAILLVMLLLWRYLTGTTRPRVWLALAGVAVGLTALLRLDFGGYVGIGAAAAVGAWELRRPVEGTVSLRQRWAALLRAELVLVVAAGVTALPLYAYLAAAAGIGTLWQDLIVFPATTFRAARYLPVPRPIPDFTRFSGAQWEDWVRLYVPVLTYIAALVVAAYGLLRRGRYSATGVEASAGDTVAARSRPNRLGPQVRDGSQGTLVRASLYLALSGAGLGLVVKATSRYHELHALPTAIVAAVLLTALLSRLPVRGWRRVVLPVAVAALAVLVLLNPYVLHFTDLLSQSAGFKSTGCYSQVPRAACIPLAPDQEQAVLFLQRRAGPDESIYVGTHRHDEIFANDVLFYFLAERPVATKYTELHPGLANTLPVQEEIAGELRAKAVRWVVTYHIWDSNEPNTSAESTGINYLDDYIREHYRSVVTLGNYQIWERR